MIGHVPAAGIVQPCATRYFTSPRIQPGQAGFKPEYFARLAAIEPGHFWFRARNALIQWALGKYFPNAESFFEIGCGTGYVLAGIRENFPRMRLVGSDIFTDGLVFAKARLPRRGVVSDGRPIDSV